jgi:hypothetical protein
LVHTGQQGAIVKYVFIGKLTPGVENARKGFEAFMKVGASDEVESSWIGFDGKTVINIVETDSYDMTISATFAPFFEEATVIPVVAVDDAYVSAVQAAQANWG